MLTFIYGDNYLVSKRKKSLIEDARRKNEEVEIWYADEVNDSSQIIDAAFNLSLFASRKNVFIDNLESAGKSFLNDIADGFCAEPQSSTVGSQDLDVILIFRGEPSPAQKNSPAFKKILSSPRVYFEKPLKDAALLSWIKNFVRSLGKEISDSAAHILVAECGGDMGIVASESEKLVTSVGDKKTTIEDADVIVNLFESGGGNIFKFADLLQERSNTAKVLKELRLLLENDGEEPLVILDRFQKVFLRIYRYFMYKNNSRLSPRDLSIRLGLHPYFDRDFFYKMEKSGYTREYAARILENAAYLNLRLKRLRTNLEKKIALENLVVGTMEGE